MLVDDIERKELGKIESVKFGIVENMFGVSFALSGPSWGVSDIWGVYAPGIVEISKHTKWTEEDRSRDLGILSRRICALLIEAKKTDITQLKGMPIEATFEYYRTLKGWRLLTEVL